MEGVIMATFRTNDGVELFYEDVGSGKPLVLVHGWAQSHRSFRHQVEHFAKFMRVINLDLRGHGDSEKPKFGYRISRLAKDLDELLTSLNLTDITLLGWSMGCSVIWSYLDLLLTSLRI
jgi:non-heme chloroperoxidase